MLEFTVDLDQSDWNATRQFIQKRLLAAKHLTTYTDILRLVSLVVATTIVLMFYSYFFDEPFNWASGVVAFVIFIFIGIDFIYKEQRKAKYLDPLDNGLILARKHYAIDERKILISGDHFRMEIAWDLILDIVETDTHIYLFVDKVDSLVIPKRAFDDEQKILEYLKTCHRKSASY
jgi:hypothetical protein